MRPILFDTNAYASFKRGDKEIVEIVQHAEFIGISPIVIGELISGFNNGTKAEQNKIELQRFLDSSRMRIYPISLDTSQFFSQIYCALKKKREAYSLKRYVDCSTSVRAWVRCLYPR